MLKKIIAILFLKILFVSNVNANPYGRGELKLTSGMVDYFIKYIRGERGKRPSDFYVTLDGTDGIYWYCGYASQCAGGAASLDIKECERKTGKECAKFAKGRSVKWKNGINPGKGKESRFNSKDSTQEIKDKLTKLGFYGSSDVDKIKSKTSTTKNQYSLKGARSIALQWEGYSDLIAGTINFDEKNYQGTLKLPLPNNDGTCNGSYTLQKGGNGVWQMTCTNNNGASGTLKWDGSGGVTGIGRDYKNKKLKFTVAKKS